MEFVFDHFPNTRVWLVYGGNVFRLIAYHRMVGSKQAAGNLDIFLSRRGRIEIQPFAYFWGVREVV